MDPNRPTDSPITISVEEAAAILGIGRSLAYDLARRGELPGVLRLGHRLLVSRPLLEKRLGIEPLRDDERAAVDAADEKGGDQ